MKKWIFKVMLVFATLFTVAFGASSAKAIIVFDASGSMWGQINGKPKITIAKDALKSVVKDWNSNVSLGLMVYGHRRKGDCNDIESVVPVGAVNKSKIINSVMAISPKGKTPISRSLKKAASELKYTEDKATIILISDGKETCDTDPCGTAKELKKEGIDFVAHVISFNVDKKTDKQLECIAHATGGEYFSAKDAKSLNSAIKSVAKKVEEPKPKPKVKKLDHNIEVSASETKGGKWIDANCRAYNEDKSDSWGIFPHKKKAGVAKIPIGKYTLKCEYNRNKKSVPFEVKVAETTKLHLIFNPFTISAKCNDSNSKIHYEIYASDGRLVSEKSIKCSESVKFTLDNGKYRVEAKVGESVKKAEFSVGGDESSLILNMQDKSSKDDLIKADS